MLLVSIHPALALLAVFALPTVLTSTWRPGVERAAQERGAQANRLARHLFTSATTAPPGKEVRVTGIGERLDRPSGARPGSAGTRPVAAARWGSAVWHTLAWAIFGGAYVGAVVFVRRGSRAPAGDVLLVLAAGARLSAYIGATVGEIGFLRGIWMDGSRRLAWLEDYAASLVAARGPARARHAGRRASASSTSRSPTPARTGWCWTTSTLELPAGAVVAIVGENGAGKSTLVKLLGKLYEPTSGAIFVDGVPLARMPADAWRTRLAGAFQDFFRFEFRARATVGLGDLPRLDDEPAVVDRGRARRRRGRRRRGLPAGLETQLGPTWPGGVEVSFGQWQKLALARGFMRDDPLAAGARRADRRARRRDRARAVRAVRRRVPRIDGRADDGRITILVSHRFSTVRMADLIVVLDGARVVEVGTHEELLARGGQYAELYGIQAAAYA